MIAPGFFYQALLNEGIDFYAGVPDSLLKEFCAYVNDNCNPEQHVICANEGNAIALAAGSYLGSGRVPLVYMQNSGLGNAVNPLLSLADSAVYAIPLLLLIGWRGEPGYKDEPQHAKQGLVQNDLLKAMQIPYQIIDAFSDNIEAITKNSINQAVENSSPVAIVVRKGTFSEYKPQSKPQNSFSLGREDAIKAILEADNSFVIVSTTGKTSRELYEIREIRSEKSQDFLTVGSMGHSSSIAAGIALRRPETRVMCIDGDGALLMHMGALAVIGKLSPSNFLHVVMNNQCHESVGGQATAADRLNLEYLAKAAGYKHYFAADNREEILHIMKVVHTLSGPVLFEIRVKKGSRADLGRPKSSPADNKAAFIKKIQKI